MGGVINRRIMPTPVVEAGAEGLSATPTARWVLQSLKNLQTVPGPENTAAGLSFPPPPGDRPGPILRAAPACHRLPGKPAPLPARWLPAAYVKVACC